MQVSQPLSVACTYMAASIASKLPFHAISIDPSGHLLAFACGTKFQLYDKRYAYLVTFNDLIFGSTRKGFVASEDFAAHAHKGIVRVVGFNKAGTIFASTADDKLVRR